MTTKTAGRLPLLDEPLALDQEITVLDVPAPSRKKSGSNWDFKTTKPLSAAELAPVARKIAAKYRADASLRELAAEYHATLPTIRRVLRKQRVEMRDSGRIAGKPGQPNLASTKLSPEETQLILKLDLQNVKHSAIRRQLKTKITRERIRQICLEAGHKPRMARIQEAIKLREKQARSKKTVGEIVTPDERAMKASALWLAGKEIPDVAAAIDMKPSSCGVQIARWRKTWPKLFPRRYAAHV